jgi:hypothetical protein
VGDSGGPSHSGSSSDQTTCGAYRSERLLAREHVPDRAGELDPGDLAASLLAEPALGALEARAIARIADGLCREGASRMNSVYAAAKRP